MNYSYYESKILWLTIGIILCIIMLISISIDLPWRLGYTYPPEQKHEIEQAEQ